MTVLNFPKIIRAAAVAVALGGTVIAAAPVQAHSVQSGPSVEFRFGGPGFGFHFDTDRRGGRHWVRDCMTNREVRRDLRRDGYRNIRFFDRRGRIVEVTASLGRRHYEIAYDSCRGRIVDRDRIRRRW
jgi:hypothetical protein